jgi:hypothetical protein
LHPGWWGLLVNLLNKGGLPPTGLSWHNVNSLAHDEMVKIRKEKSKFGITTTLTCNTVATMMHVTQIEYCCLMPALCIPFFHSNHHDAPRTTASNPRSSLACPRQTRNMTEQFWRSQVSLNIDRISNTYHLNGMKHDCTTAVHQVTW